MSKHSTSTRTKDKPHLEWSADVNELHWLVLNVPGSTEDKGEIICPCMGPSAHSGLMRYAFLVYKQPKLLAFDEPYVNNSDVDPHKTFHMKESNKREVLIFSGLSPTQSYCECRKLKRKCTA
uniref:Uncharacterized protein n=1 Tax=Glossina pallidipes TaxID=7398 RepID=A0A1A9ZJE5_GLOPL